MASILLWIIISTFMVSLIAFIGAFTLMLKHKLLNKIVFFLVALSAGALMGGAFLHLIPEALEDSKNFYVFYYVLVGFTLFFFIEKLLHWRHCHKEKCSVHSFAYMNLVGDAVHNFIDGLVIAASFVVNVGLGITTTIAIALHEIPQEIGDFGVLIYGGFNKFKALFYNFITALTAILGGILGYYLLSYIENLVPFLLAIAAGGFIYIAASDLLPELKKEIKFKESFITFIIFLFGIFIMYLAKFL